MNAPHQRVVPTGVELDDLAHLGRPGVAPLVLHPGVDHALGVDHQGGVDVVAGPVSEHPLRRLAGGQPGDVPALDQPAGVGEVGGVAADGHRALDGHVGAHGLDQLVVPAGGVEDQLGVGGRQPGLAVVAPVELHDVEPGVLAPDEQVVVEHKAGPVPVVVPSGGRHRVGVEGPQLLRLVAVEGHDPVFVVSAAEVDQRVAVGIDGHRALDEVAGAEVADDPAAGVGVQEVNGLVVGPDHHPGGAVALEHGGLAGPAGAAPVGGLLLHFRERAHRRPRREVPQDVRANRAPGPSRSRCGWGCPGR